MSLKNWILIQGYLKKHFVKNDSLRGELKPVNIKQVSFPLDFKFLKKQNPKLLEEVLYRVLGRKKNRHIEN